MCNRTALTVLALAAGLSLSACSGDITSPAAATTPATSASATASASPTATPSASPKASKASKASSPAPTKAPASGSTSGTDAEAPTAAETTEPAPVAPAPKTGAEMTDEEAYYAYRNGQLTQDEYCARPTFFAIEDAQQCFKFQYPDLEQMPGAGPRGWGDAPPQYKFTYDEAYAAWQNGMAYYDAFCLNYTPVTEAGISQCTGIRAGTVDGVTGEYIGG